MKILLSKKKCIYLIIVFIAMVISSLLIGMLNQNDISSFKSAIFVQFLSFIMMFLILGHINRSLITLYSVFLLVFYIFQNGQLLLYAADVSVDYLYVEKFSVTLLHQSVFFSNLCMFSAFAAAIFMFDEKKGWITRRIDMISPEFIHKASLIGWISSGLIAYGLIIIKLIVWLRGGYSGVIVFEKMVPSILGAIEALFPAFCILAIISGVKSGLRTRFLVILFSMWGIFTALIGDRTTGIGVVVIVLLMYYYGYFSFSKTRNKITFFVGSIMTFWLISFAFSFRSHEQFSLGSIFSVIINVIYELGFSFFPLSAIMNMCPSTYDYLYGESMFSSVVTGFFPESLDILGIFSDLANKAATPTYWIADRYQYGFGIDCSLNAEVYANFGMYGFLAMFVICAFVAAALKKVNYDSDRNIFSQYAGMALLFGWFTLPRRRSYYIYSKIFWYVIVIAVFLVIMCWISKKRGVYAKSE